jgi:hypothetical protein
MRLALLVTGCLLLACQQRSGPTPGGSTPSDPAPGDPPGGETPAPPALSLTVVDPSGATGPFRIGSLEYLTVRMSYSGGTRGVHALRLDVVDPRGASYSQVPSSLQVGDAGAASATKVIRVRGTDIQRFHQVGAWQFTATVDGAPMAAASVDVTE